MDVSRVPLVLLDTNTTSYIISGRSPSARIHLRESLAQERVAISAITEAEIRYGLELKPGAQRLRAAVDQLLSVVEVCGWDSAAAQAYARLRSRLKVAGMPQAELDLQIAADALALGATLVSHDRAFQNVKAYVTLADWAGDV